MARPLFVAAAFRPGLANRESRFLLIASIGIPLAIFSRCVRSRVQRISDPLTFAQTRVYAGATIIGYSIWICGLLYAPLAFREHDVWALSALLIPVLSVFCYASVRADLGREPTIPPSHENI